MLQINSQKTSKKQSSLRLYKDIPSKSLVSFEKPTENILQDKVETHLTSTDKIDTVDKLRQVPSEYYQQSGPLLPVGDRQSPENLQHKDLTHLLSFHTWCLISKGVSALNKF